MPKMAQNAPLGTLLSAMALVAILVELGISEHSVMPPSVIVQVDPRKYDPILERASAAIADILGSLQGAVCRVRCPGGR